MSLPSELLTAALVVYWPACAVAGHLLAPRQRPLPPIVLPLAAFVYFLLLVLLQMRFSASESLVRVSLGTWWNLSGPQGWQLSFEAVATPGSVSLLMLASLATIIAFWPRRSAPGTQPSGKTSLAVLWPMWWLAGLACVTGGNHLLSAVIGAAVASAASVAALATAVESIAVPCAARRLLMVEVASLALLIAAAVFSQLGVDTMTFSAWRDPARLEEFRQSNPSLLRFTGICLAGSLLIRLTAFPWYGWLDRLADIPARTALNAATLGQWFLGAILFLRAQPIIAHSPEAIGLTAAWAGLSALLALYVALTRSNPGVAIAFAASAQWLVLLSTLAAGAFQSANERPATAVAAALSAMYLLVLSAALLSRLAGQQNTTPPRWMLATAIFTLLGLFPSAGVLSQSAMISVVQSESTAPAAPVVAADLSPDEEQPPAGFAPQSLLRAGYLFAIAAQFLAALLAVRLWRLLAATSKQAPAGRPSPHWLEGFAAALLLLPLLLAALPGNAVQAMFHDRFLLLQFPWQAAREPLMAIGIAQAAGLATGWIWHRFGEGRTIDLGALSRMSRRGMYVEEATLFGLDWPLRTAGQLLRLADRAIVDSLLLTLPQRLPGWVSSLHRTAHHESSAFYVAATLLATAVLGLAFLWTQG